MAEVKKPVLLVISITPFSEVVATRAIISATGVTDADSNRVLRPLKLGALAEFAHWKSIATMVADISTVGVIPITKDCDVPAAMSMGTLRSPLAALVAASLASKKKSAARSSGMFSSQATASTEPAFIKVANAVAVASTSTDLLPGSTAENRVISGSTTLIVTVAASLVSCSSATVNRKLSVPAKFVSGVYKRSGGVPDRVPLVGNETILNCNGSLSASKPLRVMPVGVSVGVEIVSASATGALFSGGVEADSETLIDTLASILVPKPSLTVKVKLSIPVNEPFGVYTTFGNAPVRLPPVGKPTIEKLSASLSTSLPTKVMASGVSAVVASD